MALKGKIYSLAKQKEDIDSRNVFESMIKRSAGQNSIFLDGRNLAAGSIFAEQISAGAITTGKIKADAVTTDKIIAGAITAEHLAANSVTAKKISVDKLSAITSDIGTITAGLIKSKDDSSYFNMTQGKFSFANDKILYDGKDLSISADSINLEGKVTFSSFNNLLQTDWSDSVKNSSDAKAKTDEWSWRDTTEIDGGSIRAETITAEQIQAKSITSEEISVNELSSIASNIGTVNAGLIKSFDESIIINLDEGLITLGKPLKIQGKTVATEDDIKSETNNIRNDMDNLVTLNRYNSDKEKTDGVLNDYQVAIDVARRELNGLVNEDGELILGEDDEPIQKGVVNEVMDLLNRTALVESDYEEYSKKLKFMDTEFVTGAEGLFIGDTETKTGIMISPRVEETTEHEARASRIDFLDNNEVVAYISSYMMEITRGIFVQSAQIGEHKIETIGDGHTTFQWIPK